MGAAYARTDIVPLPLDMRANADVDSQYAATACDRPVTVLALILRPRRGMLRVAPVAPKASQERIRKEVRHRNDARQRGAG